MRFHDLAYLRDADGGRRRSAPFDSGVAGHSDYRTTAIYADYAPDLARLQRSPLVRSASPIRTQHLPLPLPRSLFLLVATSKGATTRMTTRAQLDAAREHKQLVLEMVAAAEATPRFPDEVAELGTPRPSLGRAIDGETRYFTVDRRRGCSFAFAGRTAGSGSSAPVVSSGLKPVALDDSSAAKAAPDRSTRLRISLTPASTRTPSPPSWTIGADGDESRLSAPASKALTVDGATRTASQGRSSTI